MTRISFIIATYNRAAGIVQTLTSLLGQTLPREEFEVVVANNNSNDTTEHAIGEFAAAHPDLRIVYCFEPQQGLSFARNCAIFNSSGDVLVVIDDDEIIDSRLAEVYLSFFDSHPEAAAAGGVVVPIYGIERPKWFSPYIEELISGEFHWGDRVRLFSGERYPRGGNFAIRRSAIDRYGLFNTELGRKGSSALGGEEKDLLSRLTIGGEKIYYLPGASIEHIIPDAKVTDEYFERITRMIGISEKVRTLSVSRRAYIGRLLKECVKWCGASVLSAGYLIKGQPSKGWYLVKMRWNISLGMLRGK